MKPYTSHMKAAIDIAEKHQTPFGAVLAMGDEIFVEAANQTRQLHDPTAHAEVMAIRKLGEHLQKTDLSGFTLYTTCEPCPMCTSATIWAKVGTIVYGTDIPTITKFMPQISLRAQDICDQSFTDIEIVHGFMGKECTQLLRKYG
ncbi:MAG TPA: nucleoside deaminase [Balneolaceae bacterium]|nr:nucleoside deaminase [Balneolaceae bacterium]